MTYFDTSNAEWFYPGATADFAFCCVGDCMEPTFHEGELVLIRRQSSFIDGQIVAVRVDGRLMLKRAYKTTGGRVLFVMDNKRHRPFLASNQAVEVLGVAVGRGCQPS